MDNRGRIAAVEPVRHRYFRLRANLERHGATCVVCYLKDGRSVCRHTPQRLDRVLLDAPCSSKARFRADDPRGHQYRSRRKIGESSRKQRALIQSAFQCLRTSGRVVYSTRSFAPAIETWADTSYGSDARRALRILPDGVFEGFFVCRIRKLRSTRQDRVLNNPRRPARSTRRARRPGRR
jgi:16S rRNA (cytosine1407-C5)-methyltransferase